MRRFRATPVYNGTRGLFGEIVGVRRAGLILGYALVVCGRNRERCGAYEIRRLDARGEVIAIRLSAYNAVVIALSYGLCPVAVFPCPTAPLTSAFTCQRHDAHV
jgi:hypothetical protein